MHVRLERAKVHLDVPAHGVQRGKIVGTDLLGLKQRRHQNAPTRLDLAHPYALGQLRVLLLAHPGGALGPGPLGHVVRAAVNTPLAKVNAVNIGVRFQFIRQASAD